MRERSGAAAGSRGAAAPGPALIGALLLCGWLAGLPATASAQSGRVSIELDRHLASVGEELQVTVTIQIEGSAGYSRFIPPSFEGFRSSGGSMTSQNIEMVNWQVKRTETHTYTVMPHREGVLTVGPAAIVLGGRMIRSGTVTLRVKKGAPSSVPDDDQPEAADPAPDGPLQPVFIGATATPSKVYLGQQVVAVWSLYTQSDVLGFQPLRQPTTDNFWSEDLRSPQRLELERRMVGDRPYYAAVLSRKALFPQKTGKLQVGAMEAQVRTSDNFLSASTRRSQELTIEVLPLPGRGRPSGFAESNVGQYELWASLDRATVKAGDAVTLKLVVRGTGNLSQLRLPPLPALDGFKVYEPKVNDRLNLEDQVQGEKVVEYLLMPVKGGRLTIPSIRLDYFDPVAGSYRQASSTPLSLTVSGELPGGARAGDPTANVLGPNIRPPRPDADLSHRQPDGRWAGLFWILLTLPAGLLVLLGAGERLRARLVRETAGSLRRAAARQVRAHLQRAQEARRRGDASAFFGELAGMLRTQLDRQMRVHSEGYTREELRETMQQRGLPEELVESIIRELDNCDFARFAPSASGDQQMGEAAQRARLLVERIARLRLSAEAGS